MNEVRQVALSRSEYRLLCRALGAAAVAAGQPEGEFLEMWQTLGDRWLDASDVVDGAAGGLGAAKPPSC